MQRIRKKLKLFSSFFKQGIKKFAPNLNLLKYRQFLLHKFQRRASQTIKNEIHIKFNAVQILSTLSLSILKDSRKLVFPFPSWILKNSFKTVRIKRVCKWLMKEGDLKLKFLFDRWSCDPVWSLRWEFVKKGWKRGCLFFMIDAFREMKSEASSSI